MVVKKIEEGSTITLDYDEDKDKREEIPVKVSIRKSRKK
jgi:hypothetical protein